MSLGALIEKFRAVALDRIEKMNLTMVLLERNPGDAHARDELMREIHTLKGEAKMMGFADINLVAHQTEHLLLVLAARNFDVERALVDVVFEGLDLTRQLLTKSAGAAERPVDLAGFIDRVTAARNSAGAKQTTAALETSPTPPREQPVSAPTESPAPFGDSGGWARPSTGRATRTRIQAPDDERAAASEPGAQPGAEITNAAMLRIQSTGTLRVDLEKLESLGDVAADVLLLSRRFDYRLGDLEALRGEFRGWLGQVEGTLPKSQQNALRNLVHRLDAFETSLREEAYLVSMRSGQLDEQTRRLRHVPLAQVLSHYPRAVRDLASAQGKRVRLVHAFGDVEVDRAILSAMSEPLLHLVRNAVDHGIEPPEQRAQLGKEGEGEIGLLAEHVGDGIRVVLYDDGRGIDPNFIRAKAFERGLINAEQAETLSDQDAIALIFEAGFSTRDAVDDISGRGIGMDVVRRQISRLGGYIEIESEVGKGTSFMLHLPVSSAVSSVLIIVIGARRFAIAATDVERVDVIGRDELRRVHGGVCVRYSEELVALVDWAPLLGIEQRTAAPMEFTVLLVRKGTRKVAVWVDTVIGEHEAISRPLGEFLGGIRPCQGVALTDAGEVVPLLNVLDLLTRTRAELQFNPDGLAVKKRWTAIGDMPAIDIKTILVVEDSEVTRALVTSILRGVGYRVLEADDGDHGLRVLERNRVDLVLTDVQMPRMNGLELLAAIRASSQHARLPVIVLSTLGEPEDKERAMQLGANGYLVKLNFQEKELLNSVRRYI
ncbi:MAG: response regulator [Bradymonadaceae bacterium]|nr:response regulator [Lujinxingiaceae bacterium]